LCSCSLWREPLTAVCRHLVLLRRPQRLALLKEVSGRPSRPPLALEARLVELAVLAVLAAQVLVVVSARPFRPPLAPEVLAMQEVLVVLAVVSARPFRLRLVPEKEVPLAAVQEVQEVLASARLCPRARSRRLRGRRRSAGGASLARRAPAFRAGTSAVGSLTARRRARRRLSRACVRRAALARAARATAATVAARRTWGRRRAAPWARTSAARMRRRCRFACARRV
jgi:hypothetical protein